MRRAILRGLALLLAAGFVWLNVDYWRDPPYWRRWWDTVTHPQPDHFAFAPVEAVAGVDADALTEARAKGAIDPVALRAAEDYARRFDSFAFIVLKDGALAEEWYAPGWSRYRLTQSQSMHKTVVALALGAAIHEGFVQSIDDPVSRYLPEWAGDERGRITLRNLLNMSSGLAQYAFTLNPFAQDSAFRFLFAGDRTPVVLRTPLRWQPGSRYEYNDVNAQLVGLIVERATGQRYAAWLSKALWKPVRAPNANVWLDRKGGGAMTACCMLAPAIAWARIGELLRNGGQVAGAQVYPGEWIGQMITPSPRNPAYGLFTWLGKGMNESKTPPEEPGLARTEPYLPADLFMLLGYGGQRVYVSRSLGLVVVRMGPFAGYRPLKPGWDDAYLINTIARGLKPG